MDLLLISDENKSHYVYLKDFNRFMCNRTKNKNKKYFSKCCLQCFSSERVLIEHKENCLIINGKQTVKLKVAQLALKIISNNYLFLLKFILILNVFLKKLRAVIQIVAHTLKNIRGKNAVYRFIKAIHKGYNYCREVNKKHFSKNLIMSAEEEEKFQLTNSCWICDKLFDVGDDKSKRSLLYNRKI